MYPDSVITVSKKGKREVRRYIANGKFVKYDYINAETGVKEESKVKIVLKDVEGNIEEYFIIPISENKFLMNKSTEKGARGIWIKDHEANIDNFL